MKLHTRSPAALFNRGHGVWCANAALPSASAHPVFLPFLRSTSLPPPLTPLAHKPKYHPLSSNLSSSSAAFFPFSSSPSSSFSSHKLVRIRGKGKNGSLPLPCQCNTCFPCSVRCSSPSPSPAAAWDRLRVPRCLFVRSFSSLFMESKIPTNVCCDA